MEYENAISSVNDGSYLTKSLPELREMLRACMDIHGSNPIALHRVGQAAEIIRNELSSRFQSGEPTWNALQESVASLVSSSPQDHDVVVLVSDVIVHQAKFIGPHTFLFEGVNQQGHQTMLVVHFSKLDARVVYLPKRGPSRVVTGFADGRTA